MAWELDGLCPARPIAGRFGKPPRVPILLIFPPEDGDGEAVEGLVGRLGHDRVYDLTVLVLADPGRHLLTQVLALLRHRRREDLYAVETRRRVVLMLCHRSFSSLRGSSYSSVSTRTAMGEIFTWCWAVP